MLKFISPDSIDQLRYAIKEAGGNEVFVLGQTDADRRIVQVEVLARGSKNAAPAILHIHPSGSSRVYVGVEKS